MSDVQIEIIEERKITIPFRASNADTEQIGKFIVNAAQDGYSLERTEPQKGYDQREGGYLTGKVTLTFTKKP